MKQPPRGLFITGTGTEVGKTYVASLIARSLLEQGVRVGVYKPVASGCRIENGKLYSDDAHQLWNAAGQPLDIDAVCPQQFAAATAPHIAARLERKQVDAVLLREGISVWHDQCDLVIVEGAGGLMSPLSDEDFNIDLAADFGYPLIVVSPNRLGTINQTLQTLITAETFARGMSVAGIILNDVCDLSDDVSVQSNRDELERLAIPPVIAHVPNNVDISKEAALAEQLCSAVNEILE